MRLSTSPPLSLRSACVRLSEIEPAWEEADGATWREIAVGLVEVDRTRAYRDEEWRCRDLAQYAQWNYGWTPAQTEVVLRIGRKLLDLPEIDRALCVGRITWEHVLLLTRVAVPRHELAWLALALAVPLVELAHLVARSAEGWAPPVPDDSPAEACGAALRSVTDAFDATCSRGRARRGRGGRPGDPAPRGVLISGNVCGASAPDPRREHRAPNVRQLLRAPPSTS